MGGAAYQLLLFVVDGFFLRRPENGCYGRIIREQGDPAREFILQRYKKHLNARAFHADFFS